MTLSPEEKMAEEEITRLRQRVAELEAEQETYFLGQWANANNKKDAERYRLAVDEDIDTVEIRIWVGGGNGGWEYPRTKHEADAAIDAAMETD